MPLQSSTVDDVARYAYGCRNGLYFWQPHCRPQEHNDRHTLAGHWSSSQNTMHFYKYNRLKFN